jgi:hypothetical protein
MRRLPEHPVLHRPRVAAVPLFLGEPVLPVGMCAQQDWQRARARRLIDIGAQHSSVARRRGYVIVDNNSAGVFSLNLCRVTQ